MGSGIAYLTRFAGRVILFRALVVSGFAVITAHAWADDAPSQGHEALRQEKIGVFGALEIVKGKPEDIRQWDDFRRRYAGERASLDRCLAEAKECPSQRAADWSRFLGGLHGKPRAEQIEAVNRYVNAIAPHDSDAQVFGIRDYWATPLEFFARGGDCEDFVIAKFVSLLHLGIGNNDMRIVVALDRSRNIGHAVLAVRSGKDEEILDTSYVGIWPAALIADYVPEYSLNFTRRWAHFPLEGGSAHILVQSKKAKD